MRMAMDVNTQDEATLAYAGLQPEQILDALEALSFRCDGRFLALNSYENRVYQVGLEDGLPVVAKFYRPMRWSDEAILEEHAFAESLADADLPVVPPLELLGTTLHLQQPFRFAVYPCRGGRAPDLDDLDLLRQLGRLVARIHLVGATGDFATRPAIDLESYGLQSRDYLLENELIPAELLEVYEGVTEHAIAAIEDCYARAGTVRYLRLHGDFHPGNVLIDEGQLHIVDLDDARLGPAIQDLWMFMSGDRNEQGPQLSALLDGYHDFRPFDLAELHLVEALRTLRIMHYSAWIARRWADPAFKLAFPWFGSQRYWEEHVLALREQIALMQEPPLDISAA